LKSLNFVAGSLLMFGVGMIRSGTLALMPSMMQELMNYPVFDAGWIMAPRGFGTMLAMDGRELRLRINEDTDLNRPPYRTHVNFSPAEWSDGYFLVANRFAAIRRLPAEPALRIRHWRQIANGKAVECFFDTVVAAQGVPQVI
jgi:hypothetical protein